MRRNTPIAVAGAFGVLPPASAVTGTGVSTGGPAAARGTAPAPALRPAEGAAVLGGNTITGVPAGAQNDRNPPAGSPPTLSEETASAHVLSSSA